MLQRAGEVQRGDLQPLAGAPDVVDHGVSLALGVDEHASGEVERGGVGEKLVEVGVGGVLYRHLLVLDIAHEEASVRLATR